MVRIFTGIVAAGFLSACATTSLAPQERVLGPWSCAVDMGGLAGTAQLTYRPDGTTTGPVSFKGEADGIDMDITGDVTSTWEFLADGRFRETVTGFTIKTAAFDGEVMSPALIATMIQPMIADTLEGQESITDVTFDDGTMTLSSDSAEPTICSR
jgi:hypothetical protein